MGLDGVELVMAYEESLGIEIPDAVSERLFTPRDVIDFAMQHLQEQGKQPVRAEVAETIRLVTIDSTGLDPENYREDARFIEDFGID